MSSAAGAVTSPVSGVTGSGAIRAGDYQVPMFCSPDSTIQAVSDQVTTDWPLTGYLLPLIAQRGDSAQNDPILPL